MMRATTLLLGIAALASTSLPIQARDGCGEGWFFNGVACAPMDGPTYSPYAHPRYAPMRQFGYGYDRGAAQPGRPTMGANGTISCGAGYTYQDGACRPYQGWR